MAGSQWGAGQTQLLSLPAAYTRAAVKARVRQVCRTGPFLAGPLDSEKQFPTVSETPAPGLPAPPECPLSSANKRELALSRDKSLFCRQPVGGGQCRDVRRPAEGRATALRV